MAIVISDNKTIVIFRNGINKVCVIKTTSPIIKFVTTLLIQLVS